MNKRCQKESQLFAEYVTSVAFAFSLSAPQIQLLANLHEFGDIGTLRNPILTGGVLEERGLIKRLKYPDAKIDSRGFFRACYVLTEAGLAIVPLLKIAGLYKPEKEPYRGTNRAEIQFQEQQQALVKRNFIAISKSLN